MKYMVGPGKDLQAVWQILKPCRAPEAAGIERTATESTPLNEWWARQGEVSSSTGHRRPRRPAGKWGPA